MGRKANLEGKNKRSGRSIRSRSLPNDTRRVTSESDEFRFVEIFRYFSRSNGIHRTNEKKKNVVTQRDEKRVSMHVTFENDRTFRCNHIDGWTFVG